MTDPEPRFMMTEEVAELCRTSPETVRFWRRSSRGPVGFKVGRSVLYAREDVEKWLADAREAGRRDSAG